MVAVVLPAALILELLVQLAMTVRSHVQRDIMPAVLKPAPVNPMMAAHR